MLTEVEREHLFLLSLGRPPEARCQNNEGVSRGCNACAMPL
jgi:hypothetical protein